MDTLDPKALLECLHSVNTRVHKAVQAALPQLLPLLEAATQALREGGRLLYVGAGTSGRLGVLDASECPPTFGVPPEWVQGIIAGGSTALTTAVEGAEDDPQAGAADLQALGLNPKDVVLGLSASGGAPYVLGAMAYAQQVGATTGGCSCVAGSPLSQAVQWPVEVLVGAEALTGSTRLKAGTAQKLVLNLLSTATMVRLGKTVGNLMVDVQPTNHKLRLRANRLVQHLAGVSEAEATALLQASKGHVKTAVVMATQQTTREAAQALLASTQGQLRPWVAQT
jgi:N-acetylmuramic acid 6-phosphate etherase